MKFSIYVSSDKKISSISPPFTNHNGKIEQQILLTPSSGYEYESALEMLIYFIQSGWRKMQQSRMQYFLHFSLKFIQEK